MGSGLGGSRSTKGPPHLNTLQGKKIVLGSVPMALPDVKTLKTTPQKNPQGERALNTVMGDYTTPKAEYLHTRNKTPLNGIA